MKVKGIKNTRYQPLGWQGRGITFSANIFILFFLLLFLFPPVIFSQPLPDGYVKLGKDTVHHDMILKLERDTTYMIHRDVNGDIAIVATVDVSAAYYTPGKGKSSITGFSGLRTLKTQFGKFNEDSVVSKEPYHEATHGMFRW